jgi:sigma-B regulation protein RsbU (phosphoserine phosphatase)
MHRFFPSGMYAAATIAWLGDDGRIHLTNAGLPYPYVLRAEQKKLEQVPISGMPLGIFGKGGPATFDAREIVLEPGDTLLLTSDGIGDVQGADGEMFADNQLEPVLASRCGSSGDHLVETLIGKAKSFSEGRPIPDDISMVAVTRM